MSLLTAPLSALGHRARTTLDLDRLWSGLRSLRDRVLIGPGTRVAPAPDDEPSRPDPDAPPAAGEFHSPAERARSEASAYLTRRRSELRRDLADRR